VTQEFPPSGSGIANVAYQLRNSLLELGDIVHVLSTKGADLNVAGILQNFPGLLGTIPLWDIFLKKVSKVAADYDLIWLHSPILVNHANLCFNKKIVVTLHSTYYGFHDSFRTSGLTRFLPYYYFAYKAEAHFFEHLSKNKNAIVTAVSPSVAEESCKNGLFYLPKVIPNGLKTDSWYSLDKQTARKLLERECSLCFSEEDKLILSVGRLTNVKQTSLLAHLFENLALIKPNYHLLLIGAGNLYEPLKTKYRNNSNIHVLGPFSQKALSTPLRASDAFISLSCYEGLPLAVLEATSFNLPLILSNIPSHKWIIDSKIGSGILVDSYRLNVKTVINFLDALDRTCNDSQISLNDFTWHKIALQYSNLFNDFLKQ
jgi:glycosyltransferase involved in cell wall biosynthesis